MGPNLTIVLNDYAAIKAAFIDQGDIFSGRTKTLASRYHSTGSDGHIHGLFLTEGDHWKTSRRFALQVLRDLGMGKSILESRILDEFETLSEVLRTHIGKPFDTFPTFRVAVSNVVSSLCFGKRFPHDNEEYEKILQTVIARSQAIVQSARVHLIPLLKNLPKTKKVLNTLCWTHKTLGDFVDEQTDEQRLSFDKDGETRHYIDAFLKQQQKLKEKGDVPSSSPFSDQELHDNLITFYAAGTNTTAATLQWIFLFLLRHPEIQTKVQKEIDSVVDKDQLVTVGDRSKTPYTEAVIREAQRFGNVAPFGVFRSNIVETTLNGYRIPERSFILPNFISVNMDPKLYDEPTKFKPERFLDSAGKVVEPPFFMPFSTGKRDCMGESLARMELFLFFANIMKRFTISSVKGEPLPDPNDYVMGISCHPKAFNININLRE